MSLGGQTYGSSTSRLLHPSHVKAFHTTEGSGPMVTSLGVATIRNVSFAQLEWFGEHQERHNLYPALVEATRVVEVRLFL